jgi:hypothetical protein
MIFLLLDQVKLMHPHSHQANQKFISLNIRLKLVPEAVDPELEVLEPKVEVLELDPVLDSEAEMVVESVLIQDPVALHSEDQAVVLHSEDTHQEEVAPHLPIMDHPVNQDLTKMVISYIIQSGPIIFSFSVLTLNVYCTSNIQI